MPNDALANDIAMLMPLPEFLPGVTQDLALSEPDYLAFCEALEASTRGRAFLSEYARRNRHANTEVLLNALDRLQALVGGQSATSEADRIRQELRALLVALEAAAPAVDASSAALKAARLAAIIAFVQHRIESIANGGEPPPPAAFATLLLPDDTPDATRAHLAVVPNDEEPELPIPSPDAVDLPLMAIVLEDNELVASADEAPVVDAPVVAVVVQEIAPASPEPAADLAPTIAAGPPAFAALVSNLARRMAAVMPEVDFVTNAPPPRAIEPAAANAPREPQKPQGIALSATFVTPDPPPQVVVTFATPAQPDLPEPAADKTPAAAAAPLAGETAATAPAPDEPAGVIEPNAADAGLPAAPAPATIDMIAAKPIVDTIALDAVARALAPRPVEIAATPAAAVITPAKPTASAALLPTPTMDDRIAAQAPAPPAADIVGLRQNHSPVIPDSPVIPGASGMMFN